MLKLELLQCKKSHVHNLKTECNFQIRETTVFIKYSNVREQSVNQKCKHDTCEHQKNRNPNDDCYINKIYASWHHCCEKEIDKKQPKKLNCQINPKAKTTKTVRKKHFVHNENMNQHDELRMRIILQNMHAHAKSCIVNIKEKTSNKTLEYNKKQSNTCDHV